MRLYIKIASTLTVLILLFGVVFPFLFSGDSTELFYIGYFFMVFVLPYSLYYIWRKDVSVVIQKIKNEL